MAGARAAARAARLAPLALYGVLGATVWDRPLVDRVGSVACGAAPGGRARRGSWAEQLSYLWQLYLPRAPNLNDLLPGVPPYDTVVQGPGRPLRLARLPASPRGCTRSRRRSGVIVAVLALLCALWQRRAALRAPLGEPLVFGALAAGLAVAIGGRGLPASSNDGGAAS